MPALERFYCISYFLLVFIDKDNGDANIYILFQGEDGSSMFFIEKGEVAVKMQVSSLSYYKHASYFATFNIPITFE